jgi:hypothetical protein
LKPSDEEQKAWRHFKISMDKINTMHTEEELLDWIEREEQARILMQHAKDNPTGCKKYLVAGCIIIWVVNILGTVIHLL